jgi:hypothetical protein
MYDQYLGKTGTRLAKSLFKFVAVRILSTWLLARVRWAHLTLREGATQKAPRPPNSQPTPPPSNLEEKNRGRKQGRRKNQEKYRLLILRSPARSVRGIRTGIFRSVGRNPPICRP